ncbi:hypothetical protein GCM10010413_39460 [Promicromonospora sukumoe]
MTRAHRHSRLIVSWRCDPTVSAAMTEPSPSKADGISAGASAGATATAADDVGSCSAAPPNSTVSTSRTATSAHRTAREPARRRTGLPMMGDILGTRLDADRRSCGRVGSDLRAGSTVYRRVMDRMRIGELSRRSGIPGPETIR